MASPWVNQWAAYLLLKEFLKLVEEGDAADAEGDSDTAVSKWQDAQSFLAMARTHDNETVEEMFCV